MERQMIVILPTSTGYVVGTTPDRVWRDRRSRYSRRKVQAPQTPRAGLASHINRIKKWMRLSKRYSN